jgi:hypothetical protein
MIPLFYLIGQSTSADAVNVFHTLADRGPWALAVFLVLVNIATSYALFKFFTKQLDTKEATNRAFTDVLERQTAAFNRRTRAENTRTEMEALQFAARTDLHQDLKQAATQVIQKIKDQTEEDAASLQK